MAWPLVSNMISEIEPSLTPSSLLVQQTEALETLIQYAQDTTQSIEINVDWTSQEKVTLIDTLAQEVSEQLFVLADQHTQTERQFESFQRMLRRQGHPMLTDTVERVKEGLNANFVVARQHLDAIISGRPP